MDREAVVPPNGFYSGRASRRQATTSVTPTGRRPRMAFRTPTHSSAVVCGVHETARGHYQPRQGLLDTRGLSSPPGNEVDTDYYVPGGLCEAADINQTADHSIGDHTSRRLPLSGSSQFNCSSTTTYPQPCASSDVDIVALLQQQQAMIRQVLTQQELIKEKQLEFECKLETMENQMANMQPSASSTSSSSPDRPKIRVPRLLSKKVSSVHDALEDGFDPSKSSTSVGNKRVKQNIVDQILKSPECAYNEQQIKAAVQRKYESLRRELLKDEKDTLVETQKKKYRSRRQRKFSNRSLVVQCSEKKYWEQLSLEYMTEESDDSNDLTVIVKHRSPWRSKRLCDFLALLDKRYENKVHKEGGLMAKKTRKSGSPSSSAPPFDAPSWTVDPMYHDNPCDPTLQEDVISDKED